MGTGAGETVGVAEGESGLGAGMDSPFVDSAAEETAQGNLDTVLKGLGYASTAQTHAQNMINALKHGSIFAAVGSGIHAGLSLKSFAETTGIGEEQVNWVFEKLESIWGMVAKGKQDGAGAENSPADVDPNEPHAGHAAQFVEDLVSGKTPDAATHINNILGAFGRQGEQEAVEVAVSGALDALAPETFGVSEIGQPFVSAISSKLIEAKDSVIDKFHEALETNLGNAPILQDVAAVGQPLGTPASQKAIELW
ncbi:MAG: hypothetical protein IT567_06485 [Alphaproteobacteria bacterium]|nr:hypothetical protein [Alphaproteobacteria bacterium]